MKDCWWELKPSGHDVYRRATKTLTFVDGTWRKDAGADITEWEAHARPFPQSLPELWECLVPMMVPGANAVWIRGEPTRALANGERCNRRLKPDKFGRAPDWRTRPDGCRVICVDVDGGVDKDGVCKWAAPEWLSDAPGPVELARLAEYARERLPEPFRRAGAVYRYSSGMGTTGGWREIRCHLWFFADRAVPDAELRRYFKAHNEAHPACAVDTQLYTGNQIHYLAPPICEGAPDPIGAGRFGVLDGAPEVVLPSGLRSDDELAAVVERKRVATARRTEVARERCAEHGGTLPPGVGTEALERALERLERAPAGERNSTMYAEVMRVWRYVNAGALDEHLATARLAELYGWLNPDDASNVHNVIERARREARPIDIGDALEHLPVVPTEHEPATHADIGELREWLAEEMSTAVERGGVTVFGVTPGAGKSTTALRTAVDVMRDGGHVYYFTQTRALRDAMADKLREHGRFYLAEVGVREARTPDNCLMHETYYALDKRRPGGGSPFCGACPHNPSQNGQICDFWHGRLRRQEQRRLESATFATHAFALLAATPSAVDIGDAERRVPWQRWQEAVAAGARVRPVLHRTSTQVHVVPVLARDGEAGVELNPLDFTPPDGDDVWPAENRATVLLMLARLLDCSTDIDAIVTTLVEQGAWHLPELAIIDESIMGELASGVSADARELGSMSSEIAPGPVRDRLLALVAEGGNCSGDDLARELDGLVLTVAPGEYRPSGDEQTMRHWRVVDALRTAMSNGWRGAYVRDGRLHLTYFAPVDWSRLARAVVVLDGDASPGSVRAMFGASAEYRRATLPVTHVNATRIDISTGKGKGSRAPSERVLRTLRATLQKFGHERSVMFTHQAWVESLTDLNGEHGAVDYYGSARSRGSNAYEGCDLLACEFHVSAAVVDARAYAYSVMAGDDWSATCDDWRSVARADLERATFTQAVHRARPALATAERPVNIVVLDRRPLRAVWPEFGGTETVVCPDRLVAEVTGYVWGRGGHLALASECVRACGGVFAPALMPAKIELGRIESSSHQGSPDFRNIYMGEIRKTLMQAFVYAGETHFRGDFSAFATAAGCTLTSVPNSLGGAVAFYHVGELTPGVVLDYLASVDGHRWRWFELAGKRYSTAEGDDERDALVLALLELPVGLSAREQDALLAELLGVSVATVQRRLHRYALTRPRVAVEHDDTTVREFCPSSREYWDLLPDDIGRVLAYVGAQVPSPVLAVAQELLADDVVRYNAAVERERIESLLELYTAFAGEVLDDTERQRSSVMFRWLSRLPVPVPAHHWRAYAPDVAVLDTAEDDADWRDACRRIRMRNFYALPAERVPIPTFTEWQSTRPARIDVAAALAARCYARPGAPAPSGVLLDA